MVKADGLRSCDLEVSVLGVVELFVVKFAIFGVGGVQLDVVLLEESYR